MTISEVSATYGLTPDTLRYYEKIGLLPPVPRKQSGLRDYDEESCNWIGFIKCFRKAGVSIESLTKYVSLFMKGDETREERRLLLMEELENLDKRIAEMQETRERLKLKIEHYNSISSSVALEAAGECAKNID